ncbi:LmbE-like protein [Rozella allomycis CSF55]|uniref:N-acetylglucosaminylphosphatidylinositol deacetylase n=1 Tax=Rozella allomycis (strain CSF55) TaxID=988480 RepID=A0A4P9YG39_ROZAC|nr:LmbE-like protein [Rozella allomycis CSF55]
MWLIIFISIFVAVTVSWIFLLLQNGKEFKRLDEKVAVIVAHPDDECLFFAPTIVKLISAGKDVHIFCLSNGIIYIYLFYQGNYEGLGMRREQEFKRSCQALGIQDENIVLNMEDIFKDNPSLTWSPTLVGEHVKNLIEIRKIKSVISFDDYGVSGHLNHISVFHGLNQLKRSNWDLKIYKLHSVPLWRKYLGVFDVPLTFYSQKWKTVTFTLSPYEVYRKGFYAMKMHSSQLVWFRFLFLISSRYMITNTLTEIELR